MQVGCGIRVKPIKGRGYVYFWHYESRGGRRVPVYTYMGPAADDESVRRAGEAMEAYTRRAIEEARRRVQVRKATAASSR